MLSLRRGLAFAAVAVLGAAGCALILGIDDKPLRGTSDAQPDPCEHHVPPLPTGKDDDEVTRDRYVVALRNVDLGSPDAGLLGFDLDNSCTCQASGGAHDAAPACATKTAPPEPPIACDGVGGIDTAFNAIGSVQAALNGGIQNDEVVCGRRSMLLLVSSYNGRANDKEVQLSLIITPGVQTEHDAGETPSSCNGDSGLPTVYQPRWDGTDVWSSDTRFVIRKTREPKQAAKGYVTNWMLVARAISDELLNIPIGPVTVTGHQTTIVGQITPLDEHGNPLDPTAPDTHASRIQLRGQVAARVAATDMLRALQNVDVRAFGGFLCPNNPFYAGVKTTLCGSLDIMASPNLDFTAKNCDGISTAIAFVAEPALMDEAHDEVPEKASPCSEVPSGCE